MRNTEDRRPNVKTYVSRPALGVVALLLAIVAIIVLINRSEQLQLRPASGAAHAISRAAATPPADTGQR
ncbi:hypothetical protein Q4F19_01585 [Sphingomonas sp. BIUV-7]|uniref:Uncharacterized protein n=1 Tax=Sphingomonas natans TaxID=3063330 RepID=A0ABT8Y424_9SPHN|nr:hypothetical protein [Sphingomonas sp. BIUV-7]MDO6413064.1 hypothetical protein [Sphingomonas sp. BIUV-7]